MKKQWRVGTLVYTSGGLVVLFCWLLWGDFTFYMRERSVGPTMTLVLRQLNASGIVVGILMGFLPQALSLLLVPVISYRSDRHRGRWGRRIPFLLAPTPFVFLSMLGLAFGPVLGRWIYQLTGGQLLSENGCAILALGVSWAVYEIAITVSTAVFHGLFNDVVPREVIGRFWALFRVVNLIDGMIFNYFLIGHAEKHYMLIFGGVGVFYAISFTAMCLRVKEGEYPPPPVVTQERTGAWLAIKEYMRDCFTQPFYLWYFAFYALVRWAVQPLSLFMIFFAKSLHMDMALYGKYATAQMAVSLVMAYPTGWLVDKFHALRVSIVSLALYVLATLVAFFLVDDGWSLGVAIVVCGAFAGIAGTAYQPLGLVLLPKMKFAQFNSASTIGSSLGLAAMSPLCGLFFDWIGPDYRYIYLFASVGSLLALLSLLPVYRTFMARGGIKGYVPPEIKSD
ncbi:MAG: MFS transporter [Opitutae bacterium]|nr:MFS transporter [Opitutae bacterium]